MHPIRRWPRLDVVAAAVAAVVTLQPSTAAAQAKPDFSGRWSAGPAPAALSARDAAANTAAASPPPADVGSGWGRTIAITQDDRTITVEWQIYSAYDLQPPLVFVHALDGTERVNAFALGRGVQRQRSRTRWAGDSLVITTTHAFADPVTGRDVPTEIVQTLVLESSTSLVVHMSRPGTSGGASPTTRTVYTKGGGA